MRFSRKMMRVTMVVALVAVGLFAMGGVAFATDPPINSDPANPQLGDPVGSNVSPHGGYSTTTNFCLNCHSVHAITSEYALMAFDSVTATCRTCHAYFGNASPPGPTTRPTYAGRTKGTAADRSAYDLEGVPGNHSLGETAVPAPDNTTVVITQSDWAYRAFPARGDNGPASAEPAGPGTSSAAAGGLYCASCHTPHGDFGQLINSRWYRSEAGPAGNLEEVLPWEPDGPILQSTTLYYLWQTPAGVWQKCTGTGGTGTCTNLTTTSTNGATGQYLYGYKLLSAYPNHNYGTPESWGVAERSHDAARWCGACHPSYVTSEYGAPFTGHNHPTGCTACHGNPNTAANPALTASFDFPHTSTVDKFLRDYPDSLCINCHTAGSLP